MGYKVAVVGATGNVGREMLDILAERQFPADEVVALASSRSIGTEVSYGDKIFHVHAKDVRRSAFERLRARRGSFLEGVLDGMFTVPGDGDLDFDAVAKALADVGYAGWVVLEAEQDPARADPVAYSRIGLATLNAAWRAQGMIE